jgi:TP901 family phage tail tape measure protein
MAGELLPPVVQEFIANTEQWIAGVEAAAESTQAMVEAAARVDGAAAAMAESADKAAADIQAAFEKAGTAPDAAAAGIESADAKITASAEETAASVDASVAKIEEAFGKLGSTSGAGATEITAADDKVKASADSTAASVTAATDKIEASYGKLGSTAGAGTSEIAAADDKVKASADGMAAAMEAAGAKIEATFTKLDGAAGAFATSLEAAEAKVSGATKAASDAAEAGAAKTSAAMETTAAKSAEAGTAAEGMGSKGKEAFLALGAGVGYGIDQAMKFSGAMTQLNTQAGVSKDQLGNLQGTFGQLGQGVLALAGQVGFSPDSLAESLFHVESNMASVGIKAPAALNMVKIAAEGAAVGHAHLVDVTNALTAAVASGIPGVQNMSQAMGQLNAIVGAGDMKMQDLADSMSTGMVSVVKGYGLSLKDVGAALAVFGDLNIRGAKAGTDLRMAVQALSVPVKSAAPYLDKFNMSQNTLAKDMQSGGLLKALEDLEGKFKQNGITAQTEGEVITTMFGKKAGAGLSVLMGQMDKLRSKYPDIQKSGDNFAQATATQQATMEQKWKNLTAGMQALAIQMGTALLPAATKLTGALSGLVGWFTKGGTEANVMATIIGGTLAVVIGGKMVNSVQQGIEGIGKLVNKVQDIYKALKDWELGAKAAAAAEWLLNAAMDANPIMLVVIAIAALVAIFVVLWTKCAWFRDLWKGLWNIVKTAVSDVIDWIKSNWPLLIEIITGPIGIIVGLIISNWTTIKNAAVDAWHFIDSNFIQPMINFFTKTIPSWVTGVSDFFTKTVPDTIKRGMSDAWHSLDSTFVQPAINFFTKTIPGWASDVVSFFSSLPGKIVNALGDATMLLYNWGVGVINSLINGINYAISYVFNAAKTIGTNINNALGDAASFLYNWGINMINGLIKGIEDAAGPLFTYVNNIIKSISSAVGSVLKALSPSQLFAVHGENMILGIIEGIKRQAPNAVAAMRAAVGSISGAGTGAGGGYGAAGSVGAGYGLAAASAAVGPAGGAAGGGNVIVQVDGRELLRVLAPQTYKYNLRNNGTVTGLVKPT